MVLITVCLDGKGRLLLFLNVVVPFRCFIFHACKAPNSFWFTQDAFGRADTMDVLTSQYKFDFKHNLNSESQQNRPGGREKTPGCYSLRKVLFCKCRYPRNIPSSTSCNHCKLCKACKGGFLNHLTTIVLNRLSSLFSNEINPK